MCHPAGNLKLCTQVQAHERQMWHIANMRGVVRESTETSESQ